MTRIHDSRIFETKCREICDKPAVNIKALIDELRCCGAAVVAATLQKFFGSMITA
jgi:hypothetical protein